MCAQAAQERGRVEVVDEGPLAVDLDDRQPLPVAGLELGVAADVDLFEVELVLEPKLCERRSDAFAEGAALSVIENDARHGFPA